MNKVKRIVTHPKGHFVRENGVQVHKARGEPVEVSREHAERFKDRLKDPKVLEAELAVQQAALKSEEDEPTSEDKDKDKDKNPGI